MGIVTEFRNLGEICVSDENTQKLAIKMKHDLSKSHSAINEANKLLEETRLLNEKQSKIINKFTIENIRLQKEINYYKEITLNKNSYYRLF